MADKNVLLHNDSKDNIYPLTKLENVEGAIDLKNKLSSSINQDTEGWLPIKITHQSLQKDASLKYKIKNRILFITGWITPSDEFDTNGYNHVPISDITFDTDNPDFGEGQDYQAQDFQPVGGGGQPLTLVVSEGKLCLGWFQHVNAKYYRIHFTLPLK